MSWHHHSSVEIVVMRSTTGCICGGAGMLCLPTRRGRKEAEMEKEATYPIREALKAQGALRQAVNLPPEQFPLSSFVGMVSDEIEVLRKLGRSNEEIAAMICASSAIEITAAQVSEYYAPPELRGHPED